MGLTAVLAIANLCNAKTSSFTPPFLQLREQISHRRRLPGLLTYGRDALFVAGGAAFATVIGIGALADYGEKSFESTSGPYSIVPAGALVGGAMKATRIV